MGWMCNAEQDRSSRARDALSNRSPLLNKKSPSIYSEFTNRVYDNGFAKPKSRKVSGMESVHMP